MLTFCLNKIRSIKLVFNLFLFFAVFHNSHVFLQENEIFLSGNILLQRDLSLHLNDTTEIIRIAKVDIVDNQIYSKKVFAISYKNNKIQSVEVVNHVNEGKIIFTKLNNDDCILKKSNSPKIINNYLEKVIFSLVNESHNRIKQSKGNVIEVFNAMQSLLLILNYNEIEILNEFCLYSNLDFEALELQLLSKNVRKDKRKVLLISQLYASKGFVSNVYPDIEDVWLKTFQSSSVDFSKKIFKRSEIKKIKKGISGRNEVELLNPECWLNYL